MLKYEYTIHHMANYDISYKGIRDNRSEIEIINEFAHEGWELVCVVPHTWRMIFKRPSLELGVARCNICRDPKCESPNEKH